MRAQCPTIPAEQDKKGRLLNTPTPHQYWAPFFAKSSNHAAARKEADDEDKNHCKDEGKPEGWVWGMGGWCLF